MRGSSIICRLFPDKRYFGFDKPLCDIAPSSFAGADGVEAYNYQYHWGRRIGRTTSWPSYMWPAALGYLDKLADPQEIAQHDRHYQFYPLWQAHGGAGWAQTGHHDDRIFLDRAKRDLPGSQQFRVAEDLSDRRLRAGFTVNQRVLSHGQRRLERMIADGMNGDNCAFVAYVLSQAGDTDRAGDMLEKLLSRRRGQDAASLSNWS